MYTSHDKLDLGVHGLVKHFGGFSTTKVDIWGECLEMVEIVICQTVECVSLDLSIVL
jgi:hypothetical protein